MTFMEEYEFFCICEGCNHLNSIQTLKLFKEIGKYTVFEKELIEFLAMYFRCNKVTGNIGDYGDLDLDYIENSSLEYFEHILNVTKAKFRFCQVDFHDKLKFSLFKTLLKTNVAFILDLRTFFSEYYYKDLLDDCVKSFNDSITLLSPTFQIKLPNKLYGLSCTILSTSSEEIIKALDINYLGFKCINTDNLHTRFVFDEIIAKTSKMVFGPYVELKMLRQPKFIYFSDIDFIEKLSEEDSYIKGFSVNYHSLRYILDEIRPVNSQIIHLKITYSDEIDVYSEEHTKFIQFLDDLTINSSIYLHIETSRNLPSNFFDEFPPIHSLYLKFTVFNELPILLDFPCQIQNCNIYCAAPKYLHISGNIKNTLIVKAIRFDTPLELTLENNLNFLFFSNIVLKSSGVFSTIFLSETCEQSEYESMVSFTKGFFIDESDKSLNVVINS
eukprot:TRINITY_DN646_c0_g1_i1.p1 TRINITY_DN646_c0_g1~~TRINITY_DN646_c0_g1_i1.p1  ORF type:complete len:442 (-),score=90.95 TRINITY_DN646_c0_g1_i1:19-1344(-)